jgi:hypothetical protein
MGWIIEGAIDCSNEVSWIGGRVDDVGTQFNQGSIYAIANSQQPSGKGCLVTGIQTLLQETLHPHVGMEVVDSPVRWSPQW